ncbi:MAG: helix-turn-helix transcriptional regulator [Subdoligranulum sp.]|nr:helix-turn-helix transcriptional regulator [Subdoligranulum sp.]
MDQQKIGRFLKTLRKEKGLTQEALAERLGVTSRSVSRWETGSNLPDLSLLIEIADLYGVELREILDGERIQKNMNKEIEETARKVADYSDMEKERLTRRIHYLFVFAVLCFIVFMGLDAFGLAEAGATEAIADIALGFVFGMLLVGALFTSRVYPKIRQFKQKLLHR